VSPLPPSRTRFQNGALLPPEEVEELGPGTNATKLFQLSEMAIRQFLQPLRSSGKLSTAKALGLSKMGIQLLKMAIELPEMVI